MTRSRSVSCLVLCSASAALALAGCGSSVSDNPGTGGTAPAASGGTSGSGGANGTGGAATGSGGTTAGSGGTTSTGSGGHPTGSGGMTAGSGGQVSGSGGPSTGGAAGGAGAKGGNVGSGGFIGGGGHAPGMGGYGGRATATGGAGTGGSPGVGGAGMPSGMSAGCGKAPTIASSMYNNGSHIAITAANMQRRYILNVPTNYDNTHPYKLVIAYHELNGNDNEIYAQKYYNLLPQSNNTAIFVAPNGMNGGSPCSGNGRGESGCGWPNTNNADLMLADELVKTIEDNFCVDTNRIFATGWSYGGSMSYKTACERPLGGVSNGYIRAIAVYSGSQLSGTCTPTKPVAYYASHGTHDSVLMYSNGVGLAQNFAKANGCTWATPTAVMSGAHVCTNLTGCKSGYPVQFCSFNGDHVPFPDTNNESTSWGPPAAWTFFSQF